MVARVNVPGVGPMFFPDDMSDEDIKARVNDTISGMKRAIPEPTPSGKSVASKDFSDPQREILDTIAGTESPDYNTLYGGRKVADLSKHPGIDVPITSGPNVGKTSSAFGRYQFIEPTWKEQANKLGLKDMSPESQDRAAWNLASETYKGKTGKDLADDWANSDPAARKGILSNLAGVWTSLPSGIEQNRKYAGGQKFQGNAKDLPTSELLKGGWERGVEGMKGTFFDLIPSLGASAIGKDEYAREQLEEYKKRMEEVEEANPTAYKSYKDVESPGQALDYAAETLGEVGPDIASFMLGSGAGSTLGKAAARKALRSEIEGHAARYAERNGLEEAAKNEYSERLMDRALHGSLGQHTVGKAAGFGANTGTAVAAGAMNIPETFHQVYEDTGELHPGVAAAWGGVKSALDTIVPARVWGQLTGAAKDRMAAQILKDTDIVPTSWKRGFITEAAKTGAAEGLTEGMQQAIDNMASNYAGAHKDVLEGTLDSAIRGAIGGGAMGAPGAIGETARRRGLEQQELQRREELTQEQVPPQETQLAGLLPHDPRGPMSVAPDGSVFHTPEDKAEFEYQQRMNPGFTQLEAARSLAPSDQLALPAPADFAAGEGTPAFRNQQEADAYRAQQDEQAFRDRYDAEKAFAEKNKLSAILAGKGTQTDLFGGEPGATQPGEVNEQAGAEPPARSAVITADELKRLGLKPQSGFFTKLKDKDLADPAQRAEVSKIVADVQSNPILSQGTKDAVRGLYSNMLSQYGEQQKLRVKKGEFYADTGRNAAAGTTNKGPRAGAGLPSGPAAGVPAGAAGLPTAGAVASAESLSNAPNRGKKVQPSALKSAPEDLAPETQALHPDVVGHLANNNLAAALHTHADNTSGAHSQIARKLANVLGKTKINLVDNLTDHTGKAKRGLYDPETNTIHLDSKAGNNQHVLLHEATHAALSHALDNHDNQITRQLTQLFDSVKDKLGDHYGVRDVHEFTSEAWSNPEFAHKLQQLKPTGQKHSALDKFRRAVANFMRKMVGLPPKPLDSAYDKVDEMLTKLASPAPESRDASKLYGPDGSAYAFNKVERAINSVPGLGNEQKAAINEVMNGLGAFGRSALRSVIPVHALSEMAEQYFPNTAKKFNEIINRRNGYFHQLVEGSKAVEHLVRVATKAKQGQLDAVNAIMNESTLEGVDPSRSESYYNNADDKAKWRELNAKYQKLHPAWQKVYGAVRDSYKHVYDELIKSVEGRVDETDVSPESKLRAKKALKTLLENSGVVAPYFSLGRTGDYWMSAMVPDGNGGLRRTVQAFKTDFERKARMQQLARQGAENLTAYKDIGEVNYQNATPGSFMHSALSIMKDNNVPDKAIDQMMQTFIATMPETSFAKSFTHRKGTAGFDPDAIGTYARKIRGLAYQVSNLAYNPKMDQVVTDMHEQTVMSGMNGDTERQQTQAEYLDTFKRLASAIKTPSSNKVAAQIKGLTYAYTLAGNISSAIVNMTNIPMVVAPYLKGRYANGNVTRAIGDAVRTVTGSGSERRIPVPGKEGEYVSVSAVQSLANYDPNSKQGKKYATLIKVASDLGLIESSQAYDLMDAKDPTSKYNKIAGFALHHGERMGREVSLIASYNLEMERLQRAVREGKLSQAMAEHKAAETAVHLTEMTNGGSMAASAPLIAHNEIGKMAFMFKRYALAMHYLLFSAAKSAFKGASPEERRVGMRQLAGVLGTTVLFTGVQGLPLFSLVGRMYDALKDDDDDDFATATHKYLGEIPSNGVANMLTGLNIKDRMSLDSLFKPPPQSSQDLPAVMQAVELVGGIPAFSILDRLQRGAKMIGEGHVERGLESALPPIISNPLKAMRYYTEGATTMKGDEVAEAVGMPGAVARAIGFEPESIAKAKDLQNAEYKKLQALEGIEKKIRNKYVEARRYRDFEAARDAYEEFVDFGSKHRGLGINGVTARDMLDASWVASQRATKETEGGVRKPKKYVSEFNQFEKDWND